MELEEAIIKSIRAYYEEQGFENYEASSGKPFKYTKKYFDEQEADLVGDLDVMEDEDGEA